MLINWLILIVMTVLGVVAWYYYNKLTKKSQKEWGTEVPKSYVDAERMATSLGKQKHCSKNVLGALLKEKQLEPDAYAFALENAELDYELNAEFQARAFLEMFQHVTKEEKQELLKEHLLGKCGFTEAEVKHAMAFTVDLESEFIDPYHVK